MADSGGLAGFVGGTYVAASVTQDDQECINWYAEVDPTEKKTDLLGPGDRQVTALYPCPGTTMMTQLATLGPVRGMGVLPGGNTLLAVCGTALYSITLSYVATQVGALLTSTGPVSITNNGTSAYLCDGSNRYYYTWGTSTFAIVADGAFTGANTVDIIDNYIVYNNPNSNQWGCTNVGSVVSGALNFASMLVAPGYCIGLICDHRNVFILGEKNSEVWNDVGSSPFPFAIVPGTSMQHGLAARGTVARLGESFAFLAQDDRGQAVVVKMEGYSPARISTHAVEQAMSRYAIISDAIAYTYQQAGHEFYMLTFPTADVTWCYDLSTQLWHKRAWRDQNNVYHRHRGNCAAVFGGQVVIGDYANGRIYKFDQSIYTDATGTAGAAQLMPCVRRARHLTSDLKRQFFGKLQIQFQPGVGVSGAEETGGIDYLELTNGNDFAATPDSAALSFSPSIEFIAYVNPNTWENPSGIEAHYICAKGDNASQQQFFFRFGGFLNSKKPQIITSANGSTLVSQYSSAALTVADGTALWLRGNMLGNDGGGNRVYKFYTSSDSIDTPVASINWTQLGTTITTAGVTTIFDSTSQLYIGSGPGSPTSGFPGKIYLVNIYNGIGGTLVSSMDARAVAAGSPTFISDATGEEYTLNGDAIIAGNYVVGTLGVNPQAMLRWSDDGGFTFSNEHWAYLGKMGAYKNRAIWRNLGEGRDRVFEVVVTDPVYRVVVSAQLSYSAGAH